jgi:hypothetical protein
MGQFIGVIKVPADFPTGKHVLMYAEASPYTSCLEFTVTGGGQETSASSALPGSNLVLRFIVFLMSLAGAV